MMNTELRMKKSLLMYALVASTAAFSQVGIGTSNPQQFFHVDGAKNNPTTGAPSAAQAADDFVVTAGGSVGIGTTAPNAKLDIRTNPTSTTDPGAGMFGLGTTATTAETAGAGALRYSTSSGGVLQYSNGVVWNTLSSTVQKSLVVASKWTSTQTISNSTISTITNWTEITDNNNTFNSTNGRFTAPRDGVYTISGTLGLPIANDYAGWVETIVLIRNSSGTELASYKSPVTANSNGSVSIMPGAAITITLNMTAGQTAELALFNSTGATRTLRYNTGSVPNSNGFNNISIIEL